MDKILNLIEDLSNTFGPPGFEDDVIDYVDKRINFTSKTRDSINNLILGLNEVDSNKPTIALDCHSDEVGFIVEGINKNGTISFLQIGGWYISNIPSSIVIIKNSKGEYIRGVVGSKPPHFMTDEEKIKLPKFDELYIDIGTSSYEQTKEIYGIDVGDPIAPDVKFVYDEKINIMRGKAFDNRLGCACMVNLLEHFNGKKLNINVVGAMSAQEETGLRGAIVSANRIKPDFAIILEGSPADDTFKDDFYAHGKIGKGVQLRVIDGQMITNPRVTKFVRDLADKKNIPYQIIAREKGSTNGGKYHTTHYGIPTVVLGIATRYIHTHHSYASLDDVYSAINLSKEIIENLTQEQISKF